MRALLFFLATQATAHPHVFVDGGVDFVIEQDRLSALKVTWLYDEFETLYILSSLEVALTGGTLSPSDTAKVTATLGAFAPDFDGSAHLTIDGAPVALDWPRDVSISIIDGRLRQQFLRDLPTPTDVNGRAVQVGFYESTYFYAFRITQSPTAPGCAAQVIPFVLNPQDKEMQAALAQLGREETPDFSMGSRFADRIVVTCD